MDREDRPKKLVPIEVEAMQPPESGNVAKKTADAQGAFNRLVSPFFLSGFSKLDTMFSSRLLFAVFCFCVTLRLSLSSPALESRKEALSAIFDYLEKRANDNLVKMDTDVAEAENDLREEDEADFGVKLTSSA